MTFLRIEPQRHLSELLLKQHHKVLSVKLENLREVSQPPPKLKLVAKEECDARTDNAKKEEVI